MLSRLFIFEIRYAFRRPAIYLCFCAFLVFTFLYFSFGIPRVIEKQHINSPALIAATVSGITMLMTIVCSFIMGLPLYRDLESNTKAYLFTFPITKAGYFFGRFSGAFVSILVILLGAITGMFLGSEFPVHPREGQYAVNEIAYYLHPVVTIALPNLLLVSSLFFTLVALTRSVTVIYGSGILLFFAYGVSNFYSRGLANATLIHLVDPFAFNSLRIETSLYTAERLNNTLVSVHGLFLANRLLWLTVAIVILVGGYLRFDIQKFIINSDSGSQESDAPVVRRKAFPVVRTDFGIRYRYRTFLSLIKVEVNNVVQDHFFWIVVGCAAGFLLLTFLDGVKIYGVANLPRTSFLLFALFNSGIIFFIFVILTFYAGEILWRERSVRFSIIGDSLPPSDVVFFASKLTALFALALLMCLVPLLLAIIVQILNQHYIFEWRHYIEVYFLILVPRAIAMSMLAFFFHTLVNNKFAAHTLALLCWITLFALKISGAVDYNLFLFSFTPDFIISDFNGTAHFRGALIAFNTYWLLFGLILSIIAYAFFTRGIVTGARSRLQHALQRSGRGVGYLTVASLLSFALVAGYNYYNMNVVNNYLTSEEKDVRAAVTEKLLSRFQHKPSPRIRNINLVVELDTKNKRGMVAGSFTLTNTNDSIIDSVLVRTNRLHHLSLLTDDGSRLTASAPLLFERGSYNFFRSEYDTGAFRLFALEKPIAPGDSVMLRLQGDLGEEGFENSYDPSAIRDNGTILTGYFVSFGYDGSGRLTDSEKRKKHGLAPLPLKGIDPVQQVDKVVHAPFSQCSLTVVTSQPMVAVTAGQAIHDVKAPHGKRSITYQIGFLEGDRLPPIYIASYECNRTDVSIAKDNHVNLQVFFHPTHQENVSRVKDAGSDGLRFFSQQFGAYNGKNFSLLEIPYFGELTSTYPGVSTLRESFGWGAAFNGSSQFDYFYYTTAKLVAEQWWSMDLNVSPADHAKVISQGLATYSALLLMKQKFGIGVFRRAIREELNQYLWGRTISRKNQSPEATIENLSNASNKFLWDNKMALVMCGLSDQVGEDSLNSILRSFHDQHALSKSGGPVVAADLFQFLSARIPTDARLWLEQFWSTNTVYDCQITSMSEERTRDNKYLIRVDVAVQKVGDESRDNKQDTSRLFRFAASNSDVSEIFDLGRHPLKAGVNTMEFALDFLPEGMMVDPYFSFLDQNPDNNFKRITK